MSAREDARREWRAEERASYAEWLDVFANPEYVPVGDCYAWSPEWIKRADAASARRRTCLSPESKPWRSSQRPDPRRRYSRSHRRACERCRSVLRDPVCAGDGGIVYYSRVSLADARVMYPRLVRDPHGRRA